MMTADDAQQAAAQVRRWLHARCRSGPPGAPLPTQAAIASHCGVARRTVARVVAELVAEGALVSCRGRGMAVAGAEPISIGVDDPAPHDDPIARATAWLRDQLERGVWRNGELLPSQNTIKQACGVGGVAVRGACQQLHAQGLLHRSGRRWCVGQPLQPVAGPAVLEAAWLIAPGVDGVPDLKGLYLRDIARLEEACHALGLRLSAQMWTDVVGAGAALPRALLGICRNTDEADMLVRAWRRLRRRRRDLRLVCLYAAPTGRRPQGCEVLLDGSRWTQVMRRAAEQVGRRRPARVHVVIDCKNSGTLKESIRLLPELRYRLPQVPICVQIVTPLGLPSLAAVCAHVQEQGNGTCAYLEGLLSNYRPTTLADWEPHTRVVRRPDWQAVDAGDYVICTQTRHARGAQAVCQRRGLSPKLLCLQDTPELFAAGIAICTHDPGETHRRLATALHGRLPLERTRRGLMRPGVRLLVRSTG